MFNVYILTGKYEAMGQNATDKEPNLRLISGNRRIDKDGEGLLLSRPSISDSIQWRPNSRLLCLITKVLITYFLTLRSRSVKSTCRFCTDFIYGSPLPHVVKPLKCHNISDSQRQSNT